MTVFDWRTLYNALHKEFYPSDHNRNIRSKLKIIKQNKTSIHDYNSRFRRLVIQLPDIDEDELISYYTTGLSKNVAFDIIRQADLQVRLLKSRCTLDDYMLIAEQYENASSSHIKHEVNEPEDPHGVQPMDLNYIQYRGNPQSIRRKFENKNCDYDQHQNYNNDYQNRYNHWYQNKNTRFD